MKNSFEERLEQARKTSSNEVVVQQAINNENSLSFVNPTEVVELPSKGKFYPEGHPLRDRDFVEIRQMTAKEEDILTNKSLIKKGLVIDRLIESLLLDKSIPVATLLVGDKNATMVAARIAAYGPTYDVSVGCQECGGKNVVGIDLTEIKIRESSQIFEEVGSNELLNAEQLQTGNIVIKLPRTGWTVECRLMDGTDERKILSLLETKRRTDPSAELTISEQLEIIVSSINSVTDQVMLKQAVAAMPAYDAKHLRNLYQKMIPNVAIQKKFVCRSCAEEQELEVPFTQEFFWPK